MSNRKNVCLLTSFEAKDLEAGNRPKCSSHRHAKPDQAIALVKAGVYRIVADGRYLAPPVKGQDEVSDIRDSVRGSARDWEAVSERVELRTAQGERFGSVRLGHVVMQKVR